MRKKLFYVLIGIFIIQLFVPAYMIGYSVLSDQKIEHYGKEYLIEISPYGVTDDNEVKFTVFHLECPEIEGEHQYADYIYAVLSEDSQGIAYMNYASFKEPETPYYIKSRYASPYWTFPDVSYVIDDKATADKTREYIFEHNKGKWVSHIEDTITARIYVYKGKVLVKGIYINGTPIEEYFKNS